MSNSLSVQNGVKVAMDYVLTVDGAQMDASEPGRPLEFVQGRGQIIRGLEEALLDMLVGESKEVTVAPAEGYGEFNPQAVAQVPRDRFPASMQIAVGMTLQMRGQNGQPLQGRITEITPDNVRMDFNHPLAGKTLHFKVTIADIKAGPGRA
jgi:FKBP-type peptidyl-prolyl cis-trans isomerase SlyD